MRHAVERAWHAMKHEPRFDQRHIQRAAVEGAEGTIIPGPGLQFAEHRALVLETRQHELPNANRIAVDRRAADEKGLSTRAAEKARGLEVQKEHSGLTTGLHVRDAF